MRSSGMHRSVGLALGTILGVFVLVVAPLFDSIDVHMVFHEGATSVSRNYLLPDHWKVLLLCAGIASVLGVSALRQPPVRWAASISVGVMCGWVLRVVLDLTQDPTNHNLLPIEGLIDAIGLTIATGLGAAIGYVMRKRADRELAPRRFT